MSDLPEYKPPKARSKSIGFLLVLVGLILLDGALAFHQAGAMRWLLLMIGLALVVFSVVWLKPKP